MAAADADARQGRSERRRRKDARPAEILDAAFEAFARSGFSGTRLDDVAARAGITKGTIYVYFSGKEELFVAAVKEVTRPIRENLADLTASLDEAASRPAGDILREHFGFVYGRMVADRRGRELVRMLLAEAERFPELAERWHAEVIGPCLDGLARIVRHGVRRGEFRAGAGVDYPQLLFAPVIMASTWQSLFARSRPIDLERYLDAHLDLLVAGLRA